MGLIISGMSLLRCTPPSRVPQIGARQNPTRKSISRSRESRQRQLHITIAAALSPRPTRLCLPPGSSPLWVWAEYCQLIRAPVTFSRTYEIDPDNEKIARTWFTYLNDAKARVSVVLGDGRLSMQEAGEKDVFMICYIIAAFTGDGIPAHLLTRGSHGGLPRSSDSEWHHPVSHFQPLL